MSRKIYGRRLKMRLTQVWEGGWVGGIKTLNGAEPGVQARSRVKTISKKKKICAKLLQGRSFRLFIHI
jgi:hypothetical protein